MKIQQTVFGAVTITAVAAALLLNTPDHATAASDAGVATPAPMAPAMTAETTYSSGVTEVLKLYKGGVPTDIILNYINSSTLTVYLSADNIINLQQLGLPKEVLTALLKRQGETRQVALAQAPAASAVPVPQSPAPAYYNAPPENPADNFNNALQARAAQSYAYDAPAVSYAAYPSYYDYPYYPYYPYSYSYWPPVAIGFGFGHFGGGYGHGGFVGHGGFSGGRSGGGGGHGGGHR
jgi:hypothetical protein